jgi:hypothetical protein
MNCMSIYAHSPQKSQPTALSYIKIEKVKEIVKDFLKSNYKQD